MAKADGNLLKAIPKRRRQEQLDILMDHHAARVERIVSQQHASPAGFWYDQPTGEWIMLMSGSAALLFEGELEPVILTAGDYLDIPAHRRHRVEWTDPAKPTVWLAVHYG